MSDGNTAFGAPAPDASSGASSNGASGAVDTAKEAVGTAKQEASNVAGTTKEGAAEVASTAKDEAAGVAHEAKTQVTDLYHEARGQLSSQASQQQERLASGLRSFGDELGTMSQNSETTGIAADLVQQASTRLSAAGDWLADRDPASLLDEVKAFARRRPVVFIAAAAVAGIVVGRLTRALASGGASDSGSTSGAASATPSIPPVPPLPTSTPSVYGGAGSAAPQASAGVGFTTGIATEAAVAEDEVPPFVAVGDGPEDSPLYSESAARFTAPGVDVETPEVTDERRDTF